MGQKLTFKRHLGVSRLAPNLVFLRSDRRNYVLRGRTYYLVAPLLDGSHTLSEIASELEGMVPFLELYYAVSHLQEQGCVTTVEMEALPELETLCHTLDMDVTTAGERLAETKVFVTSPDDAPVEPLRMLLLKASVQPAATIDEADLVVVVTADHLHPQIQTLNQEFLATGQPWMLVRAVDTILWLGPLFEAGQTGCWVCLAQRLRLRRRLDAYLGQACEAEHLTALPTCLPVVTETVFHLAAVEIMKWVLHGDNSALRGQIYTVDVRSLEVEKHILVKRPQCPACGDSGLVAARTQQPIVLQSRKAVFTADGGHRVLPPEETVARYKHHVSRVTGVVETLRAGRDNGSSVINTYAAGLNVEYMPKSYANLRSLLQNEDLGKGITAIQAKASALCEAIERYSCSFHGDEYRIQARYADMGEEAIHPNACMNFSERQYEVREEWNSRPERIDFHRVPPRFDETTVIDWTPVWSLTNETFKYLPTAYCYFGYPDDEPSSIPACSNGNAAGNTLEEAILHGFMELVERDSVSLWWYNRIRRPGVDLESFEDPYITRLRAYYDAADRDLWVLDITADLEIPAFAAVSRRRNAAREDIILGFGAHFDPRIGLLKALTEMNQLFSFFLAMEEGELPQGNGEASEWWQTATVENQPYLAPLQAVMLRKQDDYLCQWSGDLEKDVRASVAIARKHGLETLVLEQTQPDVGLSVAKVFVPGLRHFWRRLGPGRLYDVPVQLGWLDRSLREEELNPYSIFI